MAWGNKAGPDSGGETRPLPEKNRASGEALIAAMEEVTGAIKGNLRVGNQTLRGKKLEAFLLMMHQIREEEEIAQLDVRGIDRHLTAVAGLCAEAARTGDNKTLDRGIGYLRQGLEDYRRELARSQRDRKTEIQADREQRTEYMEKLMEYSLKRTAAEQAANRKMEKLDKDRQRYAADYASAIALRDANLETVQAMLHGERPADPAVAFELERVFRSLGHLHDSIMEFVANVCVDLRTMDQIDRVIGTLEAALDRTGALLTQEDISEVTRIQREGLEALLEQERIQRELEEASEAHATAFQEWLNNEDHRRRALEAAAGIQKLEAQKGQTVEQETQISQ